MRFLLLKKKQSPSIKGVGGWGSTLLDDTKSRIVPNPTLENREDRFAIDTRPVHSVLCNSSFCSNWENMCFKETRVSISQMW